MNFLRLNKLLLRESAMYMLGKFVCDITLYFYRSEKSFRINNIKYREINNEDDYVGCVHRILLSDKNFMFKFVVPTRNYAGVIGIYEGNQPIQNFIEFNNFDHGWPCIDPMYHFYADEHPIDVLEINVEFA